MRGLGTDAELSDNLLERDMMTAKCQECMKETFGLRCGSCSDFDQEDINEELESTERDEVLPGLDHK